MAGRQAGSAGGDLEGVGIAAVVAERVGEYAASLRDGRHDGSSGGIAEEDAGASVLPVGDLGECLGSDYECAVVGFCGEQRGGRREPVDEAGASHEDVEGRRPGGSKGLLEKGGSAGEEGIGGHGGDDDQVEIGGFDAGAFEGRTSGGEAEIGGGNVRVGDAPFYDAGASADPLVRGINHLFEVEVGQHTRRRVGPGSNNANGA